METHSPKQQRSDAEVDATTGSTIPIPVASETVEKPIIRDEVYYREMGDCVILVDTVLFKIHRLLLEKETSAFSNMFSMPQGNANNQTNSDENPLVLYDNVDDFRALCWFIYGLPTEHSQQHALYTADIQKLVSLYLISHKYHIDAHEIFARDLLSKHCLALKSEPSSKYNYFNECPESLLQTILQVAVLTEQTPRPHPFSSRLQNIWTNRLEQTNSSISFALGVGEALGLRSFLAELYYLELTRMEPARLPRSLGYAHPVSDLAPHQKLALYQGSWSLRYYWSDARQTVPLEDEHFDCCDPDAQHNCLVVWNEGWKKAADHEWGLELFDPLGELTDVQNRILNAVDACGYAPCAVDFISSTIKCLKNSLADHFLGPLPVSMPNAESSS